MFFRDQLGETLYAEYTSASAKIKKETTDKFEFYSENPSAYPEYEALSKKFALSISNFSGSGSDLPNLWYNYWSKCFNTIKEETLQKTLNELRENFIKKSKEKQDFATQSIATLSSESFNVEDTLKLMEKIRSSLGAIGSALISMITDCRQFGTTTPKALAVFTDEENIQLLNLASEKLEGLKQKSEGNVRVQYDTAIAAMKQLVEFAKENAKPIKNIDIETIAKITVGKDQAHIINMIKTACIYEGDLNPSQERISQLFMEVCRAQFQLMS